MDAHLQRFREAWLYHTMLKEEEHMQHCSLSANEDKGGTEEG